MYHTDELKYVRLPPLWLQPAGYLFKKMLCTHTVIVLRYNILEYMGTLT